MSDPNRIRCVHCERMRINHLGPQLFCTTQGRHTFKAARSAKSQALPTVKIVPVPALDDFKGRLAVLKEIVDSLILEHGDQATVEFDAGANNIAVNVLIYR